MRIGIICAVLLAAVTASDVILTPSDTSKSPIGFVLI